MQLPNKESDLAIQLIACAYCDHVCQIPSLGRHDIAYCPRCEHRLPKNIKPVNNQHIVAFACSALILLLLSLPFDFMSFTSQGINKTIGLTDAALVMFEYNFPILALIINLTILILPTSLLVFIVVLYSPLHNYLPHRIKTKSIKLLMQLQQWCMVEIFLISIIVSMIKLVSLARIDLGLSFFAFAGFAIMLLLTFWQLDYAQLWNRIQPLRHDPKVATNRTAFEQFLSVCPKCGQITSKEHCQRCLSPLKRRDTYALQKTIAWVITAILLYIPANIYPIMTTVVVTQREPSNIISGILLLWKDQSYSVALIIFLASIIVPLLKLLVMSCLCVVTYFNIAFSKLAFTRLYSLVELIGKWSMIDVFVVVILVALIQLGGILQIYPGKGALFFAAMVFASMMATTSFDPRLLWDQKQPASFTK